MEILAKKLKERAKHLGISNAEAARRSGLEERAYAHYVANRRDPNIVNLVKIAETLGTTPNLLLGVVDPIMSNPQKAKLLERFSNAVSGMSLEEFRLCVIQAEAIAMANFKKPE